MEPQKDKVTHSDLTYDNHLKSTHDLEMAESIKAGH